MTRGCYLGYYGVNETGMNEPVVRVPSRPLSSLQSFEVKDEFEDEEEMRAALDADVREAPSKSIHIYLL